MNSSVLKYQHQYNNPNHKWIIDNIHITKPAVDVYDQQQNRIQPKRIIINEHKITICFNVPTAGSVYIV